MEKKVGRMKSGKVDVNVMKFVHFSGILKISIYTKFIFASYKLNYSAYIIKVPHLFLFYLY